MRVELLDHRAQVAHRAAAPRVLEQRAEHAGFGDAGARLDDDHVDSDRLGAGPDHVDSLRMAVGIDDERLARVRVQAPEHRHRLAGGGRLVEQGRVGDLHAGEVAHHGLEVEQRLEPSLRDLGLVRRVRRVPGGILQNVAEDDRRRHGVRVAHADERGEDVVALREVAETRDRVGFAPRRWHTERLARADAVRDGLVDQLLDRREVESGEHAGLLVGVRADVAADELVGRL